MGRQDTVHSNIGVDLTTKLNLIMLLPRGQGFVVLCLFSNVYNLLGLFTQCAALFPPDDANLLLLPVLRHSLHYLQEEEEEVWGK